MEQDKKVKVYRINYELSNSSWSAHVAAFSKKEAMQSLRNSIPDRIRRVDSISEHCELDMVSKPLREEIEKPLKNKMNALKKEIKSLRKAKDLRTVKK